MNIFDQLLADNQIPKFVRVRHEMDHSHIDDIEGAVAQAMRREGTLDRIKPGDSVCITAGSRDVANIARVIPRHLRSGQVGRRTPVYHPRHGQPRGRPRLRVSAASSRATA